ncbi:hypothetical protein LTR27_004545 [Elasticomyces elasticus]|nr:hypothetical protein LTR27_004545 [Elasticomyces elasticus]
MAAVIAKAVGAKSPVLKIVGLFKRRPGLSVQEFRSYYEEKHLPFFDEHIALPGVLRYSRRYLSQIEGMMQKLPTTTGGYDVIMEVWYKDRETFESLVADPNPDFVDTVIKDEERFIDRSTMTMYFSDDVESKDGPWNVQTE